MEQNPSKCLKFTSKILTTTFFLFLFIFLWTGQSKYRFWVTIQRAIDLNLRKFTCFVMRIWSRTTSNLTPLLLLNHAKHGQQLGPSSCQSNSRGWFESRWLCHIKRGEALFNLDWYQRKDASAPCLLGDLAPQGWGQFSLSSQHEEDGNYVGWKRQWRRKSWALASRVA